MKKRWDEKLSKVVSTKLTAETYTVYQEVAREYYGKRIIKAPSNSELTRHLIKDICYKCRSHRAAINQASQGITQRARQRRKPFDFINWDAVGRLSEAI
jgi:hypothetical protein